MSICGRVVDELEAKPPQPFARKLVNTVRLTSHALSAGPAIRRLEAQITGFRIPTSDDPRLVLRQLESGVDLYCDVTLTHVRSSSRAAVAANILESSLIRQAVKHGRSEEDGRAEAMRLMAGASDVESAMMLAELQAVVRTIAADAAVADRFLSAAPDEAVTTLRAADSAAGMALRQFLIRHGHRGYRELCMRDPSWAEDPAGLGTMMQVMLGAARAAPDRGPVHGDADAPTSPAIRRLARLAQGGARGREETKSKMALMAHRLKRGYRHLGEVLASSGQLPDADLVFFFDRSELPRSRSTARTPPASSSARCSVARPWRSRIPSSSTTSPSAGQRRSWRRLRAPIATTRSSAAQPAEDSVEGIVRVAKSIQDARDVQQGEILVAPVTDVGWTPYFTVIAALVTDIGSSVSHGAVVAREFGLPCVVNTLVATKVLKTGDRVRVDGDRGVVTRIG